MSKLNFPEGITKQLIVATLPDGSIAPIALKLLTRYTDKELTAVRNCYRVMTGGANSIGGGDNLCDRVEFAAKQTGDFELKELNRRFAFLSRNDKQMEAGLRGAFHCLSHALREKTGQDRLN